ncbi:hypothetical protein [uncultured Pseudoflavonifractor sp.]|uniref:hypothetical protein n=1 Tax=uncultured Pseudoflavonifractor sp. TaxID=1221379 RepID=UPI0025E2664E|nr:hypothetical protein [uncultured Pseudoflavonifractor sp.]
MERRKKRRRLLELVKDVLIVLLALSAVYLTMRTQIGGLAGWNGSWLNRLFNGKTVSLLPTVSEETEENMQLRPVRMSVQLGSGGRYGVQYDQTAVDALFDATASLLGDALGSAQRPVQVTEGAWREALSDAWGIYFDFRGTVPLTVLSASLSGAVNQALPEADVRRLLLAEEEGTVRLYYSNESTGLYYACDTAEALRGHVQTAAAVYSPNGTVFAYETSYSELAPYVMVAATQVSPKVYHAANPVAQMSESDREEMMEALGFHPQSNNSYRSGDRLIVNEWPDRLSILDDGHVRYETSVSNEPKYPVGTPGEPVDAAAVSQATWPLAEQTIGQSCGAARLYLIGVVQMSEDEWMADYGYCLNGAGVELGADGYAARFIIQNGQITEFELFFRSYTDTGEQSIVLPEAQAAAAMSAQRVQGSELLLAYEDSGAAELLKAEWIAIQTP